MTLFLTVIVVHLLAVMSPGPDFVVCLKNTLKYSRAAGLWTALGFASGVLVHVTYCALGIALLISQSVLVFSIVKYAGAAYLIYLGISALLAQPKSKLEIDTTKSKSETLSPWAAWRTGFITNLLNPKATLYFLGFFSVVMPPDLSPVLLLWIAFALFMITFTWFATVAVVMTLPPVRAGYIKIETWLDKVFGGLLVLLGLKVALAKL